MALAVSIPRLCTPPLSRGRVLLARVPTSAHRSDAHPNSLCVPPGCSPRTPRTSRTRAEASGCPMELLPPSEAGRPALPLCLASKPHFRRGYHWRVACVRSKGAGHSPAETLLPNTRNLERLRASRPTVSTQQRSPPRYLDDAHSPRHGPLSPVARGLWCRQAGTRRTWGCACTS